VSREHLHTDTYFDKDQNSAQDTKKSSQVTDKEKKTIPRKTDKERQKQGLVTQ